MQITFNVAGNIDLPLNALKPFQGKLKKLSTENHNKLRAEMIDDGFNFAPHVWQCDGSYFILDGHQRLYTLKQLAKEGYRFVKADGSEQSGVPCNPVEAHDIESAKRKVLQAVSQYGKLDDDGFKDFTKDAGFNFENFDFPDFVTEVYNPDIKNPEDEFSKLKEGDRDGGDLCQITFTFAIHQSILVKDAIKEILKMDIHIDDANPNKNGNAIFNIAKQWMDH